jgi:hypothetical protein
MGNNYQQTYQQGMLTVIDLSTDTEYGKRMAQNHEHNGTVSIPDEAVCISVC